MVLKIERQATRFQIENSGFNKPYFIGEAVSLLFQIELCKIALEALRSFGENIREQGKEATRVHRRREIEAQNKRCHERVQYAIRQFQDLQKKPL